MTPSTLNLQGLRRPRCLSRANSTRRWRALIGAPTSPISSAERIAVTRDMRLSSPELAAAFIEGARAQGADVVDFGMMRDRHAVFRGRAREPRRRRADHGVAQSEAVQRR